MKSPFPNGFLFIHGLPKTRVIEHFGPFQQTDLNRIKTISSTSLTKKHDGTKLSLLRSRSSHNVPSGFSAYWQKMRLSCLSLHLSQYFTFPPGIQAGLQWLWFVWSVCPKKGFSPSQIMRVRQRGECSHNSLNAAVSNARQKLVKWFFRWQKVNPGGSRYYLLFCAWNI